jgi:hypothetical protein
MVVSVVDVFDADRDIRGGCRRAVVEAVDGLQAGIDPLTYL